MRFPFRRCGHPYRAGILAGVVAGYLPRLVLVVSGFSLVYTYRMVVIALRRRQHRIATRLLVLVLLGAVFALTSTPVCGSVLDIDPIACCERHACGQSTKSWPGTRHLQPARSGCSLMSEGVGD